jgi:Family of unknown function (DUF6600)/FecR protein
MPGRVRFALPVITAFLLVAASLGAQAESHVRIVRLSYLDGHVQMAHGDQGLDRAILNTPIIEGTRILTGSDGLAEIEFEDQSALRLAENSEVKVRQLSMNDAGVKVSEIEVVKGVVFFNVLGKGGDVYRAAADGNTFLVRRDTLARISAGPDQLKLAVLKGDVQLENQPQPVSVKKNETVTLDPNQPSEFKIAHGTEVMPVDSWNKEREAYTDAYARNSGYGGPHSGYGLQDLNYYGDYFYTSGYGYVWQPYGFANSMVGWSPYSNGAWSFVPGFGYAWASAYPWGWLPFHYGSWAFLGGGVGWAWVPGAYRGGWYSAGYQPTPVVVKAPANWQPASAPVVPANSSVKPTVLVGRAGGSPAYVSGGRVPPNFSSVIPGRVAATNNLALPNVRSNSAANEIGFTRPALHHGSSSHVFATPVSTESSPALSSGYGMSGSPGPRASGAGTTAGGAHTGSASHGSGASHK